MNGHDAAVALSAAWLMGAYTTALVAAIHVARRRQPHPQPVQAVQSLRLVPPEEMLATFNRRLESARLDATMLGTARMITKETD